MVKNSIGLIVIYLAFVIAGCAPKSAVHYGNFCGDMSTFMRKNHKHSTNIKDVPRGVKKWLIKNNGLTLTADSTAITKYVSYFVGMGMAEYSKKGYLVLKSIDMDGKPFDECVLYKFEPDKNIDYKNTEKPERHYGFSFNKIAYSTMVWDSIWPKLTCDTESNRASVKYLFGAGIKKEHWWKRKK